MSSWWGYAEADPTILGVVIAAVVLCGVVYVGMRVRRRRQNPGVHPDGKRRSRG